MICLPLYKVLSDTFPWIEPLYTGTMENRQRWQDLAEKVEMGLTWIDHDTIDKPIEEFTGRSLLFLILIIVKVVIILYNFYYKRSNTGIEARVTISLIDNFVVKK